MFDAQFDPRLGAPQAFAGLQDAIEKYKENMRVGAYNDTMVEHAARLRRPDGRPYVSPEDLVKYYQLSGPRKTGFAAGVNASMMDDFKRQQAANAQYFQEAQVDNIHSELAARVQAMGQAQSAQTFVPRTYQVQTPNGSPQTVVQMQQGGAWQPLQPLNLDDPSRLRPQPLTDSTGRSIPGKWIIPMTGRVIEQEDGKRDSYSELDKQIHARTGASLGDWSNALNKRIDDKTGEFVADFPQKQAFNPATGRVEMVKGETRRMPGALYNHFRSRVDALDNPGAAGQPTASTDDQVKQQALQWARSNPQDPRAALILKRLGVPN